MPEELGRILGDKYLDARLSLAQALGGPYDARQRHQAIGVLLKDLLDRPFWHGPLFLSFFCPLLPATNRSDEPEKANGGHKCFHHRPDWKGAGREASPLLPMRTVKPIRPGW